VVISWVNCAVQRLREVEEALGDGGPEALAALGFAIRVVVRRTDDGVEEGLICEDINLPEPSPGMAASDLPVMLTHSEDGVRQRFFTSAGSIVSIQFPDPQDAEQD